MKRMTTGVLAGVIALCLGTEAFPQTAASALALEPVVGTAGVLIARADGEAEEEREEINEQLERGGEKIEKGGGKGQQGAEKNRQKAERKAEKAKEKAERKAEKELQRAERKADRKEKRIETKSRARGLERADEVAGEHGQHGRAKAREKQAR
ncbi:MAG: hypothetical protein V3T60_03015 [Candidatus Binatia bacterium]|nr:hypothetical protein [candidate division NC10 bacterium]